ncbi:MAG TPA: hypothetical protein VNY78_03465 [Edaphobacter sp.]|jgi:hypothetical protein|nr:hypothetical protein [Edaphobacter sp.]
MDPLFWMVILAVSILLLFIVAVTLGKIKRGRSSEEAEEVRQIKSRVSGEDD